MKFWLPLLSTLLVSAAGLAQRTRDLPPPDLDGRVYGHLPYSTDMDEIMGFGLDNRSCLLKREVVVDLRLLIQAMKIDGVKGTPIGVGCYRTRSYQDGLFCNKNNPDPKAGCFKPLADRALSSAPPGFSEHATGYALDFGVRPRPARCPKDVEPCFASTDVGAWLLMHATEYGFELSFPCSNPPVWRWDSINQTNVCLSPQGVTYEPWHWRWVGRTSSADGAAAARAVFARARKCFPARPGVEVTPAPLSIRQCLKETRL